MNAPPAQRHNVKITFHWMGHDCTLDAPADVADPVRHLLSALVRPAPASPAAAVRVTARADGFDVSNGEAYACATVSDAVAASELAVTHRLLEADRAHCHLHAAATVVDGGGAVLALGPSGSGKSTLAYRWYRSGWPVFGDDVVAVDENGRIHAFPRPLKVDVARLREAGEAPEDTVAWDGRSEDAWVDPARGPGWAGGGSPVATVAEIRFIEGAQTQVEAVHGAERLRMLLNAVHATGVSREASLDRLATVVERATFFRMVYGDAAAAAKLLRSG